MGRTSEKKRSPRLIVRNLKGEDAPVFSAWEKASRPYPWTEAQFLELVNSDVSAVYVFDSESQSVGYAAFQIVGTDYYLSNFMIRLDQRRNGLGGQFLEKVMILIKSHGAGRILLDVDPANTAAVGLYLKHGFKILQHRKRAYPKGEDALVMEKKWE